MGVGMARSDLSEAEWRIVAPNLPPAGRGKARVDDRRVMNGIFYVLRTGSPWRGLPERYGPCTTVYNRFNRWAKQGVWLRMFEEKGVGSRPWPFSWRTEHEDPCRDGAGRAADTAGAVAGPGLRQDRGPAPDRRAAARDARRRPRL